jgi:hypothetical protein
VIVPGRFMACATSFDSAAPLAAVGAGGGVAFLLASGGGLRDT